MEQWKVAWSNELRFLFHHMDDWVCVRRWRRWAKGNSTILWGMFCGEILALAFNITLIGTTYLNIVALQCSLMAVGFFRPHSKNCLRTVFRNMTESCWQVLTWPPSFSDLLCAPASVGHTRWTNMIHGEPKNVQLLLMYWCQIPDAHSFNQPLMIF